MPTHEVNIASADGGDSTIDDTQKCAMPLINENAQEALAYWALSVYIHGKPKTILFREAEALSITTKLATGRIDSFKKPCAQGFGDMVSMFDRVSSCFI